MTDKLTMPPGFRWERHRTHPPGDDALGHLRPEGWCEHQGIVCTSERVAIRIANDIVRPAVEAATADLQARAEKAEADAKLRTAERDEAIALAAASRGEGE